jgi:hypothetical protein
MQLSLIFSDYMLLVNMAKAESRKAGGSLVKIVGHERPSSLRRCYQIAVATACG